MFFQLDSLPDFEKRIQDILIFSLNRKLEKCLNQIAELNAGIVVNSNSKILLIYLTVSSIQNADLIQ